MNQRSLIGGAASLMVAGLLSKMLGAVARVLLTRLIGTEGMGLYQMAYPIYSFALVVAVSGIPPAVSKLLSERLARGEAGGVRAVFRGAMGLLFVTGGLASLALAHSSAVLAERVFADARVTYALRSTAPAIFLVSLLAGLRGYFQGFQDMVPTAVSQVLEQGLRVATMLVLAARLLPAGVEHAAAGAAFGAVTGAAGGLALLLGWYRWAGPRSSGPFTLAEKPSQKPSSRGGPGRGAGATDRGGPGVVRTVLSFAIPVSAAAMAVPVTMAVAAVVVPSRLQAAGLGVRAATDLFGQLTGVALTLVALPGMLAHSLATTLVPAVAEARATPHDPRLRQRVGDGLRLALALGLPAGAGLYLLAEEICVALFASPESAVPLRALALGTVFLCLQHTSTGILLGLGEPAAPARNLFLGTAAAAAGMYWLTGLPALGVAGAALGITAGFLVSAGLNLATIRRHPELEPAAGPGALRPLAATLAMSAAVAAGRAATRGLGWSPEAITAAAVGLGVATYLPAAVGLGAITRHELASLPLLGRLASRLLGPGDRPA